jgi:hypothetical protein
MTAETEPTRVDASTITIETLLPDEELRDSLRARDTELIIQLHELVAEQPVFGSEFTGHLFDNKVIADKARDSYTLPTLIDLESTLNNLGTTKVPVKKDQTTVVNGTEIMVYFVAATDTDETSHGDMSEMVYLRDHIQYAGSLMEMALQNPDRYEEEGKEARKLITSALHLMSTPSQLGRFDSIIDGGGKGQRDWPQISLLFHDLEGTKPNGWRNMQDSFQMLAHLTLDALDKEFMSIEDLTDEHKKFLASIVPFLAAVGFPKYENSGSWEEVAARRTSVMAIETALLHKIKVLTDREEAGDHTYDFLSDGYDDSRDGLSEYRGSSFNEALGSMVKEGLLAVGERIPFESPDYPEDSVKYREADATLVYLLMYDLPQLLEENDIPIGQGENVEPMLVKDIESMILERLFTLIDPETNCMKRYGMDSYQGTNFHTNEIQYYVNAIKELVKSLAGDGEVDYELKQEIRGNIVPQGDEPGWTHPIGQLASWAAKRAISLKNSGKTNEAKDYHDLSTELLNWNLTRVTGDSQHQLVLNGKDGYEIKLVAANKMPECINVYRYIDTDTGHEIKFSVPSPHTPLNWSASMVKETVGLLITYAEIEEKHKIGATH